MSADGKTLHLVFSGDDSFSARGAVLETMDESHGPTEPRHDFARPGRIR
jgi:hypothetical protein